MWPNSRQFHSSHRHFHGTLLTKRLRCIKHCKCCTFASHATTSSDGRVQRRGDTDNHLRQLVNIVKDAHEKGIKQPNTLLIMRADYMVNTLNNEVNTGAIGGLGIDRRTTELHRQMLQKVGMDTSNLPANNGDTNLIKSLFMAW
uniref:Uncharacterized protein n=1 Tax=Globodera rostochiensis TaxID=31243 RepID=A0A914H8R2_GLORO